MGFATDSFHPRLPHLHYVGSLCQRSLAVKYLQPINLLLFLEHYVISTPVCIHYGEFNTGKTSLLQCLSAMHGIRNGKVHRKLFKHLKILVDWNLFLEMNDSKVLVVLTKSSRCYVPIDDPPQIVINKLAEVSDLVSIV